MALLAEGIVEEWLNRQGYFTIRGIKLGVQEIDLLAVKWRPDGSVEARHIEVQASTNPVSPISQVPKTDQKTGRAANSAKRTPEELRNGVKEWVEKKFRRADKKDLMTRLCQAEWTSELVLNEVRRHDEVPLIAGYGVRIIWLRDIIEELLNALDGRSKQNFPIKSAGGADLIDLIGIGKLAFAAKA